MLVLTNAQFRRLFHELKRKLEEACEAAVPKIKIPPSKERMIGYGASAEGKISIFSLIIDSPAVNKYLDEHGIKKNTGKEKDQAADPKTSKKDKGDEMKKGPSAHNLAERVRQMESGDNQIILNDLYEHIYFLLFDAENAEEFFEKYPAIVTSVSYDVFYYSRINSKTERFDLTIEGSFDHQLYAYAENFHFDHEGCRLEGPMHRVGDCWLINVRSSDPVLYLDINIHVGKSKAHKPENLLKEDYLRGLLHAIASAGNPVAMECLLVSNRIKNEEAAMAKLKIASYLNLVRHNFQVRIAKDQHMDHPAKMEVQQYDLSLLDNMANRTYRILTYNYKSDLISQSRFFIGEDFLGWIQMPDEQEKMKCFITVNRNYHCNRLVVKTMQKGEQSFSTITVIEIPNKNKNKKDPPVIHGAFCATGGSNEKPVGGFFVMMEDSTAFEITTYDKNELDQGEAEGAAIPVVPVVPPVLLNELYRVYEPKDPGA